jgi:transcriptional regulator, propionate catabolism operon regulatory protein
MCAMIGAIVPDRELGETITGMASLSGMEVPCVETTPEGLVGALRVMEQASVRVLISSGRLAELLRTATTLPVVVCNPSSYDLLLSLEKARTLSPNVALLHLGKTTIDAGEIEEAMGVRVREYHSGRSAQDVRRTLEQMKIEGIEVLVSGGAITTIARGYGIAAVPVKVGRATVHECLDTAVELIETQNSSDSGLASCQSALELAGFGTMVVDRDGGIVLMNSAAREIAGIQVAETAKEIFGEQGWAKLSAGTPGTSIVFGERRAVAEYNGQSRVRDMSVITLYDQPLLRRLLSSASGLEADANEAGQFKDLVAISLAMGSVIARAQDLARTDTDIMIYGLKGTGRNSIAQAIHSASRRSQAQFWRLNAMLPERTIMADLVGSDKAGDEPSLLERAHGGTVYIHECPQLCLDAQKVILEVLERKVLLRADGTRVPCDVRVLLSSSIPLKELVEQGRFLSDLYDRVASHSLTVPAMAERQEDVLPLFIEFLKKEGVPEPLLSASLQRRMLAYSWPGNVTELRNFASRLASLYRAFPSAVKSTLEKTAFDEMEKEMGEETEPKEGNLVLKPGSLEFLMEQIIEQMDKAVGGNKSELARKLGVSRTTLWKKMKPEERREVE